MRPSAAVPLLALVLFGPSIGVALKFFGGPLTAVYAGGLVAAFAILFTVERSPGLSALVQRHERLIALAWVMAMAAALAILYPIAQSGLLGPGSDRDDALMVGIEAILSGRYPYYERVYRNDVLSTMPGPLLLGIPFHLAGHVVIQNFVLTVIGALVLVRGLAAWRTRWLIVGMLTLGNVAFMQDYATGGDYMMAPVTIGIAVALVARTLDRDRVRLPELLLACVLLGFFMGARPIYPLVGVAMAAHAFRVRGLKTAMQVGATAFATAAVVTLPFYLYDPTHFTPLHILNLLPPQYRFLNVLCPALALALALLPAVRRFDVWGVFGVLALGYFVMLGPPSLARHLWVAHPWAYLAPAGLFAALAVLGRLSPGCMGQGTGGATGRA